MINKKKKKGFTLVEIIVVIAIIAILASLAIPKLGEVRNNANEKSDIANAKTIANATSALIMEGAIKPSTTAVNLGKETTGDAVRIRGYLQGIPVPKGSEGVNFIVKTENGDVKVYLSNAVTNLTDENQVYPEPEDKSKNIWYGAKENE